MVKAENGKQYIVTKTRNGTRKSQIVTIDYIFRPDYNQFKHLLYSINRLAGYERNPLPPEIWDLIFRHFYAPEQYQYHYGLFGYHDGFCNETQIRELNSNEKLLVLQHRITSLPNEFNHSLSQF